MDSGYPVILGALIALTGSALIPWLRDSLTQRRTRGEAKRTKRDDALVDFLAKNLTLGYLNSSREMQATKIQAFEERAHAGARLMLQIEQGADRVAVARLLTLALPFVANPQENGEEIGWRASTLNDLLIKWSAGEIATSELLPKWHAKLAARLSA